MKDIIKVLKKALSKCNKLESKYKLEYKDLSDGGVSRLSIVKTKDSFVKMLFGVEPEPTEVARIISSPLEKEIQIMVFERGITQTLRDMLEQVKYQTGKEYKLIKGY